MKILFLTENFHPDCDANGNCVKNIVESMSKQNHECVVLCSAPQKTNDIKSIGRNCKIVFFSYDNHITKEKALETLKSSFGHGLYLCGKVIQRRIALQYSPAHIRWFAALAFKKRLCELLETERFDAIVCAFFPVEFAVICAALTRKQKLPYPYFLHQVDTYVTNSTLASCFQTHRSKVLHQIYKYAKGVFITPLMHNEVKATSDCDFDERKFEVLEFPNFVCKMPTNIVPRKIPEAEKKGICCVYAGSLYQKIRNPDYMFRLFGALSQIGVHLYVYGKCDFNLEKSVATLFNNVHFFDSISTQAYFQVIQNADVLVNLGNSDATQLPSKIFDYFATGNPVINICKTPACPTRAYFARYPAGVEIVESSQNFDENVKLLTEFFIKRKFENHVPTAILETTFESCTPDYVARQMLSFIGKQCG